MSQLQLFDFTSLNNKSYVGSHINLSKLPKTVSEYFAGIGLVRLGLEKAGWKVIFANDFDPKKYEMYSAYFSDAEEHYVKEDIFKLDPESIPDTTLATASFPCIDLSLAGNQNGLSGKHSSAFWGFIRLLREKGEKRPPIVLIENVPGWLTSNKGKDFRATIEALNELGYACDVYSINAMGFTPQSRLRIFVMGVITAEVNTDKSILLRRPSSLSITTVKEAITSNSDLHWCFLNLPIPPSHDGHLKDIIEVMDDNDPRWWSESEVKRHLEMMNPLHEDRIKSLASDKSWNYKTMYRRRRNGESRAEVRFDAKAGCLRTARGGSSRQMIVAAGFDRVKMRHMTPREYARLQGVPDDYPLPHNTIQALTGFGDAVCVPVIEWIAENILNQLVGHLLSSEQLDHAPLHTQN